MHSLLLYHSLPASSSSGMFSHAQCVGISQLTVEMHVGEPWADSGATLWFISDRVWNGFDLFGNGFQVALQCASNSFGMVLGLVSEWLRTQLNV